MFLFQGTSDKALILTNTLSTISTETAKDFLSMAGNSMDEILVVAQKNFNVQPGTKCLSTGMGLAVSGGVTVVLTVGFMAWDARQWRLGHIDSEQFKIK